MGAEETNGPGANRPQITDAEMHSRIVECIGKLAACTRSFGLYGRLHPVFLEKAVTLHQHLSSVLSAQPTIRLVVLETCLALDSFPIESGPESLADLAESLNARGIGEIVLAAGITEEEIIDFAETLCLSPEDLALQGGMIEQMRIRQITHIEGRPAATVAETRQGQDPADIYEEALVLIEEALAAIQSGLQIPLPEIRGVVEDSLSSLTSDEGALLALAGIRSYDRYLSEHSVNVCILSLVLGRSLGMNPGAAVELGIAAMLHDVGKVFVPDQVIKKPGRLSEEEWQQVRRHPAEGARALASIRGLPSLAPTIALEHHVYGEGTGYPALAPGHTCHLLSRLVAIVDTYDALTTDRPYRERWTGHQAIAWMLYEEPRRYDRQLLARFASRSGVYPIGSLVQLKNDAIAVVAGGTVRNPTKPTIRLISGQGGRIESAAISLAECADDGLQIKSLAQPVEALLPYTDRLLAA